MAVNGGVALPSLPPPPYDSLAGERTQSGSITNTTTTSTSSSSSTLPPVLLLPELGVDEPLPRYFPPVLPFQRLSGLLLPLFILPLTLLLLFVLAPASVMSSAGTLFKSAILPALIALSLYLIIHFAVIPLYRRHRARYSQYLPVHTQNPLSSLSESTTTLRQRISSALLVYLLPSRWAEWRYAHHRNERVANAGEDDEEMGEDLEFDIEQDLAADEERERRRRDGLSLSIDAVQRGRAGHREPSSDRRLSRELEEGFADSSDEETEQEQDVEDNGRHGRRR